MLEFGDHEGEPTGDDTWDIDPDFPEVPVEELSSACWYQFSQGRFLYDEPIHLLEARTLNYALEEILSSGHLSKSRCLVLSDNVSTVLSFDRSRAKSFPLILQTRRFAGIQILFDVHIAVRWIASETNPADEGSRVFEPPESCVDTGVQKD